MKKEVNLLLSRKLKKEETVLLACSGGADSTALFFLLYEAKIPFAVAHINYHLRGNESDEDANFIEQLCDKFQIPFHLKNHYFKKEANKSIQEEARILRYNFFNQLLKSEGYSRLLTAHHRDDAIENFVFRAFRGSGLNGLTSFNNKDNSIFRPLLKFSKDDILQYLESKNTRFREDKSNSVNNYSRNRIRNIILPELSSIFPNYAARVEGTIKNLEQDLELIHCFVLPFKKKLASGELRFPFDNLVIQQPSFWIYLIDGINADQSKLIAKACKNNNNGFNLKVNKFLISLINNEVIISKKRSVFEERTILIKGPFDLKLGAHSVCGSIAEEYNFNTEGTVFLDAKKVEFPIKFRTPKNGDKFTPLGLKGTKLLSDFFNDLKIPSLHKKHQVIIEDAHGVIISCLPYRISEMVKVDTNTMSVLQIQLT